MNALHEVVEPLLVVVQLLDLDPALLLARRVRGAFAGELPLVAGLRRFHVGCFGPKIERAARDWTARARRAVARRAPRETTSTAIETPCLAFSRILRRSGSVTNPQLPVYPTASARNATYVA